MSTSDYVHSFTVRGIYQVKFLLGEGATGSVWEAFNILTGLRVAIKTQPIPVDPALPPILPYEVKVYDLLRGSEGIPSIHWSGIDGNQQVMVMDLLSPNLNGLRRVCRGTLSLRTICMLAEQMLARIQFIHSRGIISGDIKPHNFALGSYDKTRTLHLFDFSHAQLFINPSTGEHIPFSTTRITTGTIRYASVAAHKGHEVSRRDDIESLLYTLLELYHGRLPWHNLSKRRDGLFDDHIAGMKEGTEFRDFLSRSLPEFRSFHAHCMSLSYGQTPDYALLRGLFRERMGKEGWQYDWIFDWENGSSTEKGTLVPDDYVFDLRFVERRALYPS
ncbi:kinase-like protein [Lentinus tigrinus ALCF2SS1-7]|uniref:Kinase-like protein n=1 Tax=Lentinus tigrinus ALCF2SS1-6 TaxID=1328759 RepID=A0A5C2SK24_9APHY|nr:kinase-like protein [Lentinus tigrinus ALCF2SS1-6]RPD75954.1 kinase-like protein [Lentinus tigrinus ALCF2SS1-7]